VRCADVYRGKSCIHITRKLCYSKDDRAMRTIVDRMSRCGDMAIRNHPRWRPTAILDNFEWPYLRNGCSDMFGSTLEPNMKCIGSPVARYGHSHISGAYETPIWGRGGRRGSAMAPFERAMVISYRLSIVTVALSVIIRLQFAIECLRCSNQQGWVNLGPNFRLLPLE